MKKILLVSHGLMAMGIYEAFKMIAGESEQIKYVCLSDGKDIEEFKRELAVLPDWVGVEDQLFVLADIMGGSPYITTIQYLQEKNMISQAQIFAGMNLPLLLSIGLGGDLTNKDDLINVLAESKNGMQLFEYCEENEEEDL